MSVLYRRDAIPSTERSYQSAVRHYPALYVRVCHPPVCTLCALLSTLCASVTLLFALFVRAALVCPARNVALVCHDQTQIFHTPHKQFSKYLALRPVSHVRTHTRADTLYPLPLPSPPLPPPPSPHFLKRRSPRPLHRPSVIIASKLVMG